VVGAQAGLVDRQGAATDSAAAPVIAKYTGVLAAADVFTASTTFWGHGVDPPRPRLRLPGPPLSRTPWARRHRPRASNPSRRPWQPIPCPASPRRCRRASGWEPRPSWSTTCSGSRQLNG